MAPGFRYCAGTARTFFRPRFRQPATLLHRWKVPTNFWREGRLKFSPRGDLLAASSCDGSVYLLDVVNRMELAKLNFEPREAILDVAFDPGERWLAVAVGDKAITVRIW